MMLLLMICAVPFSTLFNILCLLSFLNSLSYASSVAILYGLSTDRIVDQKRKVLHIMVQREKFRFAHSWICVWEEEESRRHDDDWKSPYFQWM